MKMEITKSGNIKITIQADDWDEGGDFVGSKYYKMKDINKKYPKFDSRDFFSGINPKAYDIRKNMNNGDAIRNCVKPYRVVKYKGWNGQRAQRSGQFFSY